MNHRLPSALEVAALLRRTNAEGGHATVLRRGDPDRGDLLILVIRRGEPIALLERRLAEDFAYRWTRQAVPKNGDSELRETREKIDPDFWLIELDIADAERFVDEMIALG